MRRRKSNDEVLGKEIKVLNKLGKKKISLKESQKVKFS